MWVQVIMRTKNTVWVSYPLKQGLKQGNSVSLGEDAWCLSQLSIKTRIETSLPWCTRYEFWRLSQLSIKTRIETGSQCCRMHPMPLVWVSYPLKQGLKRPASDSIRLSWRVWVSYPLKQGLKHTKDAAVHFFSPKSLSQLSIKTRIETPGQSLERLDFPYVWVSYPLKQGLKRSLRERSVISNMPVWVSYPLKQGLKLPKDTWLGVWR